MLIYDRFVFLHMPKTAGSFLSQALREELGPPVRELETHTGWDQIPPEAAGRPVLMYVRNPWDWYVSWYHFWTQSWSPKQSPAFIREAPLIRVLFGDGIEVTDDGLRGVNDFATVIRGACDNLALHPAMAGVIRESGPEARWIDAGDDFYTARVKHLVGAGLHSELLTIGRYESLLDDLERFFEQNEIPLEDGVLDRIRARGAVNATDRRHYREYYDDDLRDLVGRSCRMLVERFGYRF